MTDLSPAAQAVLNAIDFYEMSGPQQIVACAHAAAVLIAAADRVVPKRDTPLYADDAAHADWVARDDVRDDLLHIAAELEGLQ